jgi:hypothetical protein
VATRAGRWGSPCDLHWQTAAALGSAASRAAGELRLLNRWVTKKGGSRSPRCRHGRGMGAERRRHAVEYGGDTVGQRGSVRSSCGRAARGDGVLGADVGAGAVGPAIAVVPRLLGPARGVGARSGACRHVTSRRSAFRCEIISGLPCSTTVFSKKLN